MGRHGTAFYLWVLASGLWLLVFMFPPQARAADCECDAKGCESYTVMDREFVQADTDETDSNVYHLTTVDPSPPEADDDDADDMDTLSACTKARKCAKEATRACRDLNAEVESVTFNAADHTCNTTCVGSGASNLAARYVVEIVCVRP